MQKWSLLKVRMVFVGYTASKMSVVVSVLESAPIQTHGERTMAREKDVELINFLIRGTDSGEVKWETAESPKQFSATIKGKKVIVQEEQLNPPTGWILYRLTLKDAEDREWRVDSDDVPRVRNLFQKARRESRRASLKADAMIDEIIGGEKDEDF